MSHAPGDNSRPCSSHKPTAFHLAFIFGITVVVYTMMSYGGLRSPDSEVVFRTAESLATRGSFAVSSDLSSWRGFGLPRGRDGQRYSLFGPGLAVASAPLVKIALLLNESGWYDRVPQLIPISHHVDDGLLSYVKGEVPRDLKPHALRFLVSSFNIFVGAMCVVVFYLLAVLLTQSEMAALYVTPLFAFGSLMMPYSGTFFSEPLAALMTMGSLYCLVLTEVRPALPFAKKLIAIWAAGLILGLGVATHVTTVLFAPFFCLYALYAATRTSRTAAGYVWSAACFIVGLALVLACLGYYNYVRFGDVFETGRTMESLAFYGAFQWPWHGLVGLLFSSGKGILLYCPAVALSLCTWHFFHRRHVFLSWIILGAVLARLIFVAARTDWHGGFCLGPRYMVIAIPLLLLPLSEAVKVFIESGRWRSLHVFFAAGVVCIAQQIYFCVGEVFSFFHAASWYYESRGIDVFTNDFCYTNWNMSPLLYLLDGKRGPFLFRSLPMDNYMLWSLLVIVMILLATLGHYWTIKRCRNERFT